jgi:hypothetical protein
MWCSNPLSVTLKFAKESLKVDRQKLHCSAKRQPLLMGRSRKPQSILYKLYIGVGTACGVKMYAGSVLVSCQALQKSRIGGLKYDGYVEEDPKFDWRKFLALLWPHMWYLLAAVAVCLFCTYKNIDFLLLYVCFPFFSGLEN